jgi:hypothetical protein
MSSGRARSGKLQQKIERERAIIQGSESGPMAWGKLFAQMAVAMSLQLRLWRLKVRIHYPA